MAGLPPSPLLSEALSIATEAHAGQIRNGAGGMPYIEHPVAVAELLAEHGWTDEEVLAAALLHDVVEKSAITVDDLDERFGALVAALVAALSDDESIASYRERKGEHRERVVAADGAALAIYGADKLANVRALRSAYAEQGEAVGEEFKAPLDVKFEIWEDDLRMLRAEAAELAFLDELEEELTRLREDRATAAPPPGT